MVTAPSAAASADAKRQINRHIARTAHARRRQLRVKKFQDSLVEELAQDGEQNTQSLRLAMTKDDSIVARQDGKSEWAPSFFTSSVPATLNMAPFGRLLDSFAPREQYMLHYCELPLNQPPSLILWHADRRYRCHCGVTIHQHTLPRRGITGARAFLLQKELDFPRIGRQRLLQNISALRLPPPILSLPRKAVRRFSCRVQAAVYS